MNVLSLIFASFILLVICDESIQQRHLRAPTGRRFSPGSRDASLKSVQLAEQQEVQQSDLQQVNRSPDSNCDSCKDNDLALQKDLVNLMLVGDGGILLSQTDYNQNDYCHHAKHHLKSYLKHVDNLKGKVRDDFSALGDGLRIWIHKRCSSKSYYDKFTKFSKCYLKESVHEEWQRCVDRIVTSLQYVTKSVAARNQLDAYCCTLPHVGRCVHNAADEVCGPRTADTFMDIVSAPWDDSLEKWCSGKYDCSESHPVALKNINKIFRKNVPATKPGVVYKYFLEILRNTYGDEYY